MTIHEEVSKALERDTPLKAAECVALHQKVVAALAEIEPRLQAIHPGDGRIPCGEERKRVLLSGSQEDVARLRDEFDMLKARSDQLKMQADELQKRRTAAKCLEAYQNLPAIQEALVDKLSAAEAARDALESAVAELSATYSDVVTARGLCRSAYMYGVHEQLEPAGAKSETISRLVRFSPYSMNRIQGHPGIHRDSLGVASEGEDGPAPSGVPTAEWTS